jgi:hypothetical protein
LPKTNNFGALRLFIANSISAVAHGINGGALRRGADSADKRHETLCSVFWFTPDWWPIARTVLVRYDFHEQIKIFWNNMS